MARRRRAGNDWGAWIALSATPLFLLDRDRRLVALSAGCERLTGWTPAELAGQRCDYASLPEGAGAAALAAALCPPPEVLSGAQRAAAAPATLPHKDGRALSQLLHFYRLLDEKDRGSGYLGVVLPLPAPLPAGEATPARRLHAELAAARAALRGRFGAGSLVAQGAAMRKVVAQADLARQTGAGVLLEGEPGSGKEHLARVIHLGGPSRSAWFVPLDCRRLGADELDRVWSRLIDAQRAGESGSAAPGTIYLSDVERLPRDLQERIGSAVFGDARPSPGLRLLAATSGDLSEAVARQELHADFAARISTLTIALPPLRERPADLPLLAQHFLEECNRQSDKQVGGFDEAVWPLFLRYRWPGNLDELLAVIREAHDLTQDTLIRPGDLPYRFRTGLEAQELPPPPALPRVPLDELLHRVESRVITQALARTKNNRSQAAELLGIPRARLLRRIEQLGLPSGATPGEPEPTAALDELSAELLQEDPPAEWTA